MQLARADRGQTLVEFVVAMPIVLLGLFAIIYFSQYGAVSERAELALRYGGVAEFNDGGNVYGAANIYYYESGGLPVCPTPPVSIVSGTGAFPGPTSAPFWQPSSSSSSCTPGAKGFGGSQFIASHFWATTQVNVSANVNVPVYLKPALGVGAGNANTTLTFIHAAYPGIIMWCSTEVRYRIDDAITAQGSASLPTPIPDGSTPPPTPPNNNGACN